MPPVMAPSYHGPDMTSGHPSLHHHRLSHQLLPFLLPSEPPLGWVVVVVVVLLVMTGWRTIPRHSRIDPAGIGGGGGRGGRGGGRVRLARGGNRVYVGRVVLLLLLLLTIAPCG